MIECPECKSNYWDLYLNLLKADPKRKSIDYQEDGTLGLLSYCEDCGHEYWISFEATEVIQSPK